MAEEFLFIFQNYGNKTSLRNLSEKTQLKEYEFKNGKNSIFKPRKNLLATFE